jgi:hypothetical protein
MISRSFVAVKGISIYLAYMTPVPGMYSSTGTVEFRRVEGSEKILRTLFASRILF